MLRVISLFKAKAAIVEFAIELTESAEVSIELSVLASTSIKLAPSSVIVLLPVSVKVLPFRSNVPEILELSSKFSSPAVFPVSVISAYSPLV